MEFTGAPDEPLVERIPSNIERCDSLSSSDSDTEKPSSSSPVKVKIRRMFGRERPIHQVLGGGKPADLLLWRERRITASALGAATVTWVVLELIEYHFLTFVCQILMILLAGSFLWFHAVCKSTDNIPEFHIPEESFLLVVSELRAAFNWALTVLRQIALGRDLKQFFLVTLALWFLSAVGNWFHLLTLIYICFVLLLTVPVLYERYEDEIDPFAEKAMIELRKKYAVIGAKYLSKSPSIS